MMPSGHKAFLVHSLGDVELLLMHNKTFAAEYVLRIPTHHLLPGSLPRALTPSAGGAYGEL